MVSSPRVGETDLEIDRVGRDLEPAFGVGAGRQLDRAARRAEVRRELVRIVELAEDVREGPRLDAGEELLAGRVGEGDGPVRLAHDDAFAHRPDDRIQLGRAGVFRLGQALEADLDLDPVADVARDGDDAARSVRQADPLEGDLDRDRPTAGDLVLGHDRRDVTLARRDRPDEARQSGGIRWPEELVDRMADELLAGSPQEVAGAPVRGDDGAIVRIEDDDGFDDRVEDRLGQGTVALIVEMAGSGS